LKLHIKTVLLIIVTLLLLFLLAGCLPGLFTPPTPKGVISGRVMVPSSEAAKDITGWVPAANATVTLADTNGVIHTVTTDKDGYYSFGNVAVGAKCVITATVTIDGNTVVMKDVVPQAVAAIEDYDAGTMNVESTALGLIVEKLTEQELTPEDINLEEIQASDNFTEVVEQVSSVLEENGNVTTDPDVIEVVNNTAEEIINPPAPTPTPEPEPTPEPTYTMTFDSQGGSTVASQNVNHGGKVTKPTDPTKEGYIFGGWYKEAGCTNAWAFDTDTVTSAVTIYAKWTANNYTVTFNKDDEGAAGTTANQTIASGSSANLTACGFSKTGWTFAGWAETSGGAVAYANEQSYTMGTSNVILYAQWTPPSTYSLRDVGPAGGLIFYDDEADGADDIAGARYLEAAPSDQDYAGDYTVEWGCYGTEISGADGTAVGTGKQNTIDILNGCVTGGIAARLCDAYSTTVSEVMYNDWFLPSKDELNLMYTNLKVAGVGGFADDTYWSSSEPSANYAWSQGFYSGNQYNNAKDGTYRVRAVRAF